MGDYTRPPQVEAPKAPWPLDPLVDDPTEMKWVAFAMALKTVAATRAYSADLGEDYTLLPLSSLCVTLEREGKA